MPVGAPKGNNNAAKAKMWSAAINRALDARTRKEGKDALDALAEELLKKCEEGDLPALKELGDRIEGKSAQSVTIGGDEENPLYVAESNRPQLTKEEWLEKHGFK